MGHAIPWIIAAGASTAAVILWLGYEGNVSALFKEYQTLAAGLLALCGAMATVNFLRRQIGQAEEHRQDDLKRRSRAARAVLSPALSAVCRFSQDMVEHAAEARALIENGNDVTNAPPTLADDILPTLREMVAAGDESIGKAVHRLIGAIQVLQSRAEDAPIHPESQRIDASILVGLGMNWDNTISHGVYVHAIATTLLGYARNETEDAPPPPNKEDLSVAARLLYVTPERHPRAYDSALALASKGTDN